MLKVIGEKGGKAVGITLSSDQVEVCKRHGLEAYLKDWKEMKAGEFGKFDGIISVGAFEHFSSPKEYLEGRQDDVYKQFFKLCHDTLPQGGRLYLQTSVWGENAPRYEDVSLKAPKNSNEYLLALLEKFFPGSYPPFGEKQVLENAIGFKTISVNTSTLDYIHTIKEWRKYGRKINFAKIVAVVKLLPHYITDKNFRYQIECFGRNVFTTMYKRGVMHLTRIVFEKV
jgi:cyclopropane-fatty-acyl-phospholipid synthase